MVGLRRLAFALLLPSLLVAFWQLLGMLHRLPDYLPDPSQIAVTLFGMIVSGEILDDMGISLVRAISGFIVGSFLGVVLGLMSGAIRPLRDMVEPLVFVFNPIPKIVFLPIFVLGFGLGDGSKIAVIATSTFFPVFVAAIEGYQFVPRNYVWAAKSMGAGSYRIFIRVYLPASLPRIFLGLRVGLAFSFIVLFAAELLGSDSGLGYLITTAEGAQRFDIMLSSIFTIAVMGFAADRILLLVRRWCLRGNL